MSILLGALVLIVAATLRLGASSVLKTALVDAVRAGAEGVTGARATAALVEQRDLTTQAVAVVHSALLVGATLLGAKGVGASGIQSVRGWLLLVVGLVVFALGDLVPRVLGRARPGRVGYRLSGLVAPAVWLGSLVIEAAAEEPPGTVDSDDDHQERALISSVIEFSDTLVREVMVPRTEMMVLAEGADFDEMLEVVNEHGFSRIPVVGNGIDDVIGLVIAKDLLKRLADGDRDHRAKDLMRPVDFVPETKRVSDLLREFQASKLHLAVVIDEYGATAGVVTIEDLLEELVGEIIDEFDDEEPLISRTSDSTWALDGRVAITDLSEAIGIDLPEDEWDTVAGLLLGIAGRVPKENERFELSGMEFTVLRLQGRRVAAVRVARLVGADRPAEEG